MKTGGNTCNIGIRKRERVGRVSETDRERLEGHVVGLRLRVEELGL